MNHNATILHEIIGNLKHHDVYYEILIFSGSRIFLNKVRVILIIIGNDS